MAGAQICRRRSIRIPPGAVHPPE